MMTRENKFFRFFYAVVYLPIMLLYHFKPVGRENIPEGGAIFCGNHSHWSDPFAVFFSLKRENFIHMMAKAELFKGFVGWVLKSVGSIPVKRGTADINTIKMSMKYLRAGENVCIFPEGTRISEDFAVAAKNGAIKIAEKTGKPIVPVHIPRKKRLFSTVKVVIGEPYYVNPEKERLTPEQYDKLSQELMEKIKSLDTENV